MKELRGYEGLLAAVVLEAVDDRQKGSKRHRQDAITFLESDGFDWLWEYVTDGISGMPDVNTAKKKALTAQIDLSRKTRRTNTLRERGLQA